MELTFTRPYIPHALKFCFLISISINTGQQKKGWVFNIFFFRGDLSFEIL